MADMHGQPSIRIVRKDRGESLPDDIHPAKPGEKVERLVFGVRDRKKKS